MKGIISIILLLIMYRVTAQEPLMPELPPMDTLGTEVDAYALEAPDLSFLPVQNAAVVGFVPLNSDPRLLRFEKNLKFDFSAPYLLPQRLFSSSLFMQNTRVLGAFSTQLSDRLSLGGYSLSGNSWLSAPFPKATTQNFDSYGSTVFMEYKVSKKFRIGGSISVGQNRGIAPPPPF